MLSERTEHIIASLHLARWRDTLLMACESIFIFSYRSRLFGVLCDAEEREEEEEEEDAGEEEEGEVESSACIIILHK